MVKNYYDIEILNFEIHYSALLNNCFDLKDLELLPEVPGVHNSLQF